MKKALLVAVPLVLIALAAVTAPAQIKVDGLFFDWPEKYRLDVPPNQVEKTFGQGDDTSPARGSTDSTYYADCDISHVYATDDADFVYIRVEMSSIANINNTATDTSYHGGAGVVVYFDIDRSTSTGLTWGWWGSGFDYIVQVYPGDSAMQVRSRFQQILWEQSQTGDGWTFDVRDSLVGCQVAWNAQGNNVEIAVPKSLLFHPRNLPGYTWPDSIDVMVTAGENASPWRLDYAENPGHKGLTMPIKKPGAITIDGLFFDWQESMRLDVPPNTPEATFGGGDDTDPLRGSTDSTYFADCDLWHSYATDDADFVYLRMKMSPIANVANILTDTSYHGGAAIAAYISLDPGPADTTGLTYGWWGSGYDVFIQAFPSDSLMQVKTGYQQVIYEQTQEGNSAWVFNPMDSIRGAWVSWNALNNEVEMAIPKSVLFNPHYMKNFVVPDSIAIMLYAGENASPWRADYGSNAGVAGYIYKMSGNATAVRPEGTSLPNSYKLYQNYPNPFNPSTTIKYDLRESGWVTLRVFNVLGQQVATLVDGVQHSGEQVVRFNASSLPSSVYFYRLETKNFSSTLKMMLLK